jgi:N-acetylglucosaminyldiphosphoundecaprenol N-acetyl-beta-D-mannosaminyltransferase
LEEHLSRVNILGVNVSAINLGQAIERIEDWITYRSMNYVCVTPAHSVMDCVRNPALRKIFNASGLTTPDGMSLVWLLKLKGQRHVDRVYGPDLMKAICQRSVAMGWSHYLFGGEVGVVEALSTTLQKNYPGIQIAGTWCPPFHPLTQEEDENITNDINLAHADIVWVGIGSPKQERWMAEHLGRLNAPVMVGVGAAFDYLSGKKRQAPRWMQRSGLEWLFRLGTEPRRLWRRYIQYPYFGWLVFIQLLGYKFHSTD